MQESPLPPLPPPLPSPPPPDNAPSVTSSGPPPMVAGPSTDLLGLGVEDLEAELPKPKSSRRNKVLLIFFAAVGLFLFGGFAAGFFVINEPPVQVVKLAFERLNSVKSLHSSFDVSISAAGPVFGQSQGSQPLGLMASLFSAQFETPPDFQAPTQEPPGSVMPPGDAGSFSLQFHADVDETDRGTTDARSAIQFQGSVSAGAQGQSMELGSLAGELRTFGIQRIFAQLTKLEISPALGNELPAEQIQPYLNTWIKFDIEELQRLAGSEPQQAPEQLFTPEEQQRLLDKLSRAIDLTRIDSEDIDGTATFHYRAEFVRPALDEFVYELITIVSQKNITGEEGLEPTDDPAKVKKDIADGLDEFFKQVTLSAEIWIGRWDLLPRKLMFHAVMADAGDNADVNIVMQLSKFNEPVTVEEPQGAVDIQELFSQFLQEENSRPENFRAEGRDARRQSDLTSLIAAFNLYFDARQNYPTTNNALSHLAPDTTPCQELLSDGFMSECPGDPLGAPAFYGYRSDGQTYELTAVFEDHSSPYCIVEGPVCLFRIRNGEIVSRK